MMELAYPPLNVLLRDSPGLDTFNRASAAGGGRRLLLTCISALIAGKNMINLRVDEIVPHH